jgi:hypothetical protein
MKSWKFNKINKTVTYYPDYLEKQNQLYTMIFDGIMTNIEKKLYGDRYDELVKGVVKEVPKEEPKDKTFEKRQLEPLDTPLDTPSDTPLDTPSDTPLDTPSDTPLNVPSLKGGSKNIYEKMLSDDLKAQELERDIRRKNVIYNDPLIFPKDKEFFEMADNNAISFAEQERINEKRREGRFNAFINGELDDSDDDQLDRLENVPNNNYVDIASYF